jgi:prepilin-type processing-associated H-X9-DG protein
MAEVPALQVPGAARDAHVISEILKKGYNANYTASWFFVRGGVVLKSDGTPKNNKPGKCNDTPVSLLERNFCMGPLQSSFLDSSKAPASQVPLLGDGGQGDPITINAPGYEDAKFLVVSMTRGPKLNRFVGSESDYLAPYELWPTGTTRDGAFPDGWWAVWNKFSLQDYRRFEPLHLNQANILFADGSVREFTDKNRDSYLNNGFDIVGDGRGAFKSVERGNSGVIPEIEIFSLYSLDAFKGK